MGRSQIGAKALSWRISSLPSRASSSDAAKVDARALRRICESVHASRRKTVKSRPVGLDSNQAG